MSKLRHVEELDARGRLVRVQPGLTLGALNELLRTHGLWLPVGYDPSRTIGGLISDNPSDSMLARFGGIKSFVERIEMVLPSGELIQLGHNIPRPPAGSAQGHLQQELARLADNHADVVMDRSMRPPDSAGYPGITAVQTGPRADLLPLIFGSQGTLGVITDTILRLRPLPSHSTQMVLSLHDLRSAQRFLNNVRDLEPYLLEIYDLRIFEAAAAQGKKSRLFPHKLGKGLVAQIGFDFTDARTRRLMKQCRRFLPENVFCVEETPENTNDFKEISNVLMSYLNTGRRTQRAPILDEVHIPSMHFDSFLDGLAELEHTLGLELPLYGSFIASSYTVRPSLDFSTVAGRRTAIDFLKLYSNLVARCHGSITGNLPEGRLAAPELAGSLPDGERALYTAIKQLFDPDDLLAPGVKLAASSREVARYLREAPLPGLITP